MWNWEKIWTTFKILKNQTSDDFAILCNKNYPMREDWKSVRQTAGLRDNWNDLEKHLVISSTNTNNDEITAKCFVEDNLERVEKGELLLQQLQSKNQTFVCGGLRVTDAGGRHKIDIILNRYYSRWLLHKKPVIPYSVSR